MLTLATHEPHFTILREMVFFNNSNTCHTCGQPGHIAADCRGKIAAPESKEPPKKKPYQFLYISVLRECVSFSSLCEGNCACALTAHFLRTVLRY